jgi:hypothetical protein
VSTQDVDCSAGAATAPLSFAWQTTADEVYFGVGTDDATRDPYGTYDGVDTLQLDYQCGQTDQWQQYTISIEQSDGSVSSRTLTVRETD